MVASAGTSRSFIPSGHPALLLLLLFFTPALWIVFVSTTSLHELLLGVLTCAASIVFTTFVCRSSSTDLHLAARDVLRCCWSLPWYIVSNVWEITLVLFKDLLHIAPAKSVFRVCGFESSTHDPVRVGRTVLAVAYTTAAPNFIVVGIDPAQSRMLFHQIAPSSVPRVTKALGAKA